ncbi:hypothetical protein Galf_0432 [Gallionella capsiferriformans ES-2]|uniref:Uncharacterized protein n=1 Tax=Gallionella capsiferriformans (strain ES-2) TaxID=395494 RepID=D9SJX7_GALCS|nr:hypothetical protein Galf_0432 [Gallionella capsiferriformans ES-2]
MSMIRRNFDQDRLEEYAMLHYRAAYSEAVINIQTIEFM